MIHHCKHPRGIAMIITLLVIVILTIAVTAFMQSMSLERRTSQAYLNILRADEAVATGLARAQNILAANTADDTFIVVKTETGTPAVPYYFIGKGYDAVAGSAKVPAPTYYVPLFSYLNAPPATPPTPPAASPGASNNKPVLPAFADPATGRPILAPHLQPVNTSWETINTGDPQFPKIRYTYWMEDLSGMVDTNVAGNKVTTVGQPDSIQNNQNDDRHVRDTTYGPDQLGVFTIFNKTALTDPGATAAGFLTSMRPLAFSNLTLREILGADYTTYKTEVDTSIAGNLSGDTETQVIPYGLGFVNGGTLKVDVNNVIADAALTSDQKVTKIADVININLPKFDLRKGANYGRFIDAAAPVTPERHKYAKTIAANIIDYADSNNTATVGNEYRGIDSYPFISEWANRYVYTPSAAAEGGVWKTQVALTPYLELWNLSDKSISGKFKFKQTNTDAFSNGVNTAVFTDTASLVNPTDVENEYTITAANPLAPNEYRVIQLATLTYKFPAGAIQPVFPSGGPNVNPTTLFTSKYEFSWEGAVVDEPYGKQEAVNRILTSNNQIWRAYLPGFRYYYNDPTFVFFWNATGDPRNTFYLKKPVAINTFNSGSPGSNRQTWWGRNTWNSSGQTNADREMNPSKWLDGDHGNSDLGVAVANTSNPMAVPAPSRPPTIDREAISSVSNSGKYFSITEIGNIYDPAQWNAKGTTESNTTIPNYPPLATDIPANAGSASGSGAEGWGGGMTLRIGRPEFTRFTQPDVEPAWKLLDLLSAGSERKTAGLININTASKDSLRTLVAGLVSSADPGVRTGSFPTGNASPAPKTYPYSSVYPVSSPATQADTIAQAIIDGRPYLSPSQLSDLKTSGATPKPVFGDMTRWSSTDPNRPIEWDDAGAEEMFKSVYELSTVRSRNFRIYVTGQVLNRLGKVVSSSSKVFQTAIVPTRDPTTKLITRLQINIKNEAPPL